MRIYPEGSASTSASLEQQFHMIARREEFFPSPEVKEAKPPTKQCLNMLPLGATAMPDKKPIDNI